MATVTNEDLHRTKSPGIKIGETIFEQIEGGKYAIRSPDGSIEVREFYGRYEPKDNTIWLLYPEPLPYEGVHSLYNEVRSFIQKYLYLADERHYDVLASFVLATYRWEDFDVATYLFFHGPPKSAKSRALEILYYLCYRAIKNENASLASIYYLTDEYHPTLLFDQAEKLTREGHFEVVELLNSGQRMPGVVTRLEKNSKENYTQKTFSVFGFKALAGIEEFPRTLSSRCIIIKMRKAPKRMPKLRYKHALLETKEIRAKLLTYRLLNVGTLLDQYDDNTFEDDRIAEVFEPLLAVSPFKGELISIGKEIEDQETEEEKSSWEARVLSAYLEVRKELIKSPQEKEIDPDKIPVYEVAKKVAHQDLDLAKVSSRVGRCLSRLNFRKCRIPPKSTIGYRWDEKLVRDLAPRFLGNLDLTPYLVIPRENLPSFPSSQLAVQHSEEK